LRRPLADQKAAAGDDLGGQAQRQAVGSFGQAASRTVLVSSSVRDRIERPLVLALSSGPESP